MLWKKLWKKDWRWEPQPINQVATSSTKNYAKAAFGLPPLQNVACKIWKQQRLTLILTAHNQMKRVIWNFNFMLNYICLKVTQLFLKKPLFLHFFQQIKFTLCFQRLKTIHNRQKAVQILKINLSAMLTWLLFWLCLATWTGFGLLGYVPVDEKLFTFQKYNTTTIRCSFHLASFEQAFISWNK